MALIPRQNELLGQLTPEDRDAVTRHMSDIDFELGHSFGEPGDTLEHMYFVQRGFVSAVSIMGNGETVEAYMVGSEGFTGSTAWQVPFRTSVRFVGQLAGSAQRIEARKLQDLASDLPELRRVLARYVAALQVELEQSAPCNALHSVERRFAKWLLRAHDRADGDTLLTTQEFLGNMLGAQRTTVNEAAQTLAAAGAIAYARGTVRIANRAILEGCACECYASTKAVSDRRHTIPSADI